MQIPIAGRALTYSFVAACLSVLVLSGCNEDAGSRVEKLEKKSGEVDARINDLEWKTASTKFSARLSTATDSYARLDTDVGHFFVYLKEAEGYQDGYRLSVAVGNPGNMKVHGGQVELIWGGASDKKKTFAFTQALEPGMWNDLDVFIAPATEEDVKSITMSMSVSSISLLSKSE